MIRIPELSFSDQVTFYIMPTDGRKVIGDEKEDDLQEEAKTHCFQKTLPKRVSLLGLGENARRYSCRLKTKAFICCRKQNEENGWIFSLFRKTVFGIPKQEKRASLISTYEALSQEYGAGPLMVGALYQNISFRNLCNKGRCLRVFDVIRLKSSLDDVKRIWSSFSKVIEYCSTASPDVIRAVSFDSDEDEYMKMEDSFDGNEESRSESSSVGRGILRDGAKSQSSSEEARQARIDSLREVLKNASRVITPEAAQSLNKKLISMDRDGNPISFQELLRFPPESELTKQEVQWIWEFGMQVELSNST